MAKADSETAQNAPQWYRREANFIRVARRRAPLSLAALIALVLIHAWFWLLDAFGAAPSGDAGGALLFGAKVNALVWAGQVWRLVSCQFLHGNLLHLVFNGYAIYILGPLLERFYGSRRFLVLALLSGLGGSLGSLWFTDGPSVGASGAVFGLLGALMVFGWRSRGELPPRISRAFGAGLAPWVILNLVLGFLPWLPMDNAAHIGGLITGTFVGLAMPSVLHRPSPPWHKVVLECLFALCVLTIAASLVWMVAQVATCAGSGVRFYQCYPPTLWTP